MRRDHDVAILGAGLAGLSLALRLADQPRLRVLVLEPRTDWRRDKTWSGWRLRPHPFEAAVAHRWTSWEVRAPQGTAVAGSAAHPYETIPADRLYDLALARLARAPHVELRTGARATALRERADGVEIETDRGAAAASWVFDSRPPPLRPGALAQRFLGREVRVERPVFDPARLTLMDFAVPQRPGAARFVYVLPFSRTEALVEDTWIAPPGLALPDHRAAIARHLAARFGVDRFETTFEEAGAIPMDPGLRPPARPGRVVAIGAAGGAIRAASGYGFLSVQRMADRLAADLAAGRPPRPPALRGPATRWMDAVLLEALRRAPETAPRLFERLFARCPPAPLIRFLNDLGRPADYLRVVAAMPKTPMIAAALAERRAALHRREARA